MPASKIPTNLNSDEKLAYKRAVAKMMVFWIINTRETWRARLLRFDPHLPLDQPQSDPEFNKWETDLPNLVGAFKNAGTLDRVVWNRFFKLVHAIIQVGSVQDALNAINAISETEWVPMLDPDCPADEAIDLMFKALSDRIGV